MIRHVVMIKFKKDAPQAMIDEWMVEQKKLAHLNPEVRDYSHGMCVKGTRFHSGDFDFANCCDLDSYEAMERYMSHWSHLRMTPYLGFIENMISFDWEIDYHGPAFDEEAAKAEAEREKKRVLPIHEDPAKAYVPELRGRTREQAIEMLAKVGLELGEVDEVIGSVWAPDRIMFVTPEVNSEVAKGARINIGITGDWLTGAAVPEVMPAW
jgi:hypothetical protein